AGRSYHRDQGAAPGSVARQLLESSDELRDRLETIGGRGSESLRQERACPLGNRLPRGHPGSWKCPGEEMMKHSAQAEDVCRPVALLGLGGRGKREPDQLYQRSVFRGPRDEERGQRDIAMN